MINKLFYNNIEAEIIKNISNCKKNLRIAVAWFTNPTIYNLVLKLIDKGVLVELIIANDIINFTNSKINFQILIDNKIDFNIGKAPKLMHNKFCIIDNKILINGSYNWTLKAEKINFENIIISKDLNLIQEFNHYFDYLKTTSFIVKSIKAIKLNDYSSNNEIQIELGLLEKNDDFFELSNNKIDVDSIDESIFELIFDAQYNYQIKNYEKTISFCEKQINIYPNIPDFYYWNSLCYWKLNQTEKAIDNLNFALKYNYNNYSVYNMFGNIYSNKGKRFEQEAIHNYIKCINIDDNESTAYFNRASLYINIVNEITNIKIKAQNQQKRDFDLDKIVFLFSKKNNPNYKDYYELAFAKFHQKQDKAAKNFIDKGIELYKLEKNVLEKDKNVYTDMVDLLKNIKLFLNH